MATGGDGQERAARSCAAGLGEIQEHVLLVIWQNQQRLSLPSTTFDLLLHLSLRSHSCAI
jgi:hypothetical protein